MDHLGTTRATQRLATAADTAQIAALMRASVLDLFPRFYSEQQSASAAVHLTVPDMDLIADGTYYVHEADGEVVACGGWSKREKLYTGSGDKDGDARLLDPLTEPARVRAMFVRADWTRRGLARAVLDACRRAAVGQGFREFVLMATLPGVPLYHAYGFEDVEDTQIPLPDGVILEGLTMRLALSA
ncbi:GNAT family N-acetyltransferase [Actinocrispum wychmicini]|uniref:N-acetylglutamate synthase-like GNAT family acetyltransferase n=1 Tax=Actinocrispum wychmicini TaxID=1213861 RepID=A0A4V2S3G7_9PSEU|nr:GNAT family N-acetyltransferase [Actinocrispum wychmicini]TCO44190.1 N-acetylglutamate synthase-like GNAT family acetyltransferase [Actinocrispum wychmicini]